MADNLDLGSLNKGAKITCKPDGASEERTYTIESHLGTGGMGKVYAVKREDGQVFALKYILPEAAQDPKRLTRFNDEADMCMKMDHPNIITMHEKGGIVNAGGAPYVLMEVVDTPWDMKKLSGTMEPEQLVHIMYEVQKGLEYAHDFEGENGHATVHRDIKPENILTNGTVTRVIDWGVAREVGKGSIRLTGTGSIMGTVPFMSPDQIESTRDVPAASDMFSLGSTAYTLYVGEIPYENQAAGQMLQDITSQLPRSINSGIGKKNLIGAFAPRQPNVDLEKEVLPAFIQLEVDRLRAETPPVKPPIPGQVFHSKSPRKLLNSNLDDLFSLMRQRDYNKRMGDHPVREMLALWDGELKDKLTFEQEFHYLNDTEPSNELGYLSGSDGLEEYRKELVDLKTVDVGSGRDEEIAKLVRYADLLTFFGFVNPSPMLLHDWQPVHHRKRFFEQAAVVWEELGKKPAEKVKRHVTNSKDLDQILIDRGIAAPACGREELSYYEFMNLKLRTLQALVAHNDELIVAKQDSRLTRLEKGVDGETYERIVAAIQADHEYTDNTNPARDVKLEGVARIWYKERRDLRTRLQAHSLITSSVNPGTDRHPTGSTSGTQTIDLSSIVRSIKAYEKYVKKDLDYEYEDDEDGDEDDGTELFKLRTEVDSAARTASTEKIKEEAEELSGRLRAVEEHYVRKTVTTRLIPRFKEEADKNKQAELFNAVFGLLSERSLETYAPETYNSLAQEAYDIWKTHNPDQGGFVEAVTVDLSGEDTSGLEESLTTLGIEEESANTILAVASQTRSRVGRALAVAHAVNAGTIAIPTDFQLKSSDVNVPGVPPDRSDVDIGVSDMAGSSHVTAASDNTVEREVRKAIENAPPAPVSRDTPPIQPSGAASTPSLRDAQSLRRSQIREETGGASEPDPVYDVPLPPGSSEPSLDSATEPLPHPGTASGEVAMPLDLDRLGDDPDLQKLMGEDASQGGSGSASAAPYGAPPAAEHSPPERIDGEDPADLEAAKGDDKSDPTMSMDDGEGLPGFHDE